MMLTIIAGSRTLTDYKLVEDAVIRAAFSITEIVSGCAKGIDQLGIRYAQENMIPCRLFPADEDFKLSGTHGGFARNGEMAVYAHALILIWDGLSGGSQNMLEQARFQAKSRPFPIYVMVPSFG